MPEQWRTAFLAQARSEYALFQQLRNDKSVAPCHKLHLLQMATEKLAKAFGTPPGQRPPRTHKAFVNFVQTAAANPRVRRASHFAQRGQFAAYANSLLPLAQSIEDLSPEGDDHPNPEYPWEQNGQVVSPLEHDWRGLSLQSVPMLKLLQFLDDCFLLP